MRTDIFTLEEIELYYNEQMEVIKDTRRTLGAEEIRITDIYLSMKEKLLKEQESLIPNSRIENT